MKKLLTLVLLTGSTLFAQNPAAVRLIELARQNPNSAHFREALGKTCRDADLKAGRAVAGYGPDFVWAIETTGRPDLFLDSAPGPSMTQIPGTQIWYATGQMKTGMAHSFFYSVNGEKFGGRTDVPAYGPDSYAHPGVPQGKLSEKLVYTSKIYDGMQCDYWIYVPAQYDLRAPAALMVFQDGQGYIRRDSDGIRLLDVIDNLIDQKKIPVMIGVFISPGRTLKDSMRSTEYDTVSDRYARFLRDELLADVQSKYNIRRDAYSRGISGSSSGGICSFNVAWQQPDQFSRVLSWIGSYTSIQWHPGVIDGGNVYPNKVRKEPKRNIRVWLEDGSEDLENDHGSWPLQNIQLANSLKLRGYDFHLSFGHGTHNSAHGSSQLPQSFAWLWRDYDPSRTEQQYEMEPGEKAKPLFRVSIYNRDAE